MVWARKGLVFILSLLLLVCLVGGALSFSVKQNLSQPAKLEAWLSQSNVYSNVVDNALNDAQQNASNDAGAGRVSLNDPPVVSAVKAVFTPSVVQQYTNTFLISNYAWLQGKTTQPDFKIDLTGTKQQLADKIGQAVQTRVASLPACSAAQVTQLQSTLTTDPLTIPCSLPGISAQTAGQQASQQIASSSDFLTNTTLTANTLNPNGSNSTKPYFQRLSRLPKLYQLNQRLPLIFGVVGVLSILGIIFISLPRRRGWRRLGWLYLIAGIILVGLKFLADNLFNEVEKKLFSNTNISQLQKSLTTFMHHVESQLVKVDLSFGIFYLVLAIIILLAIWFTRSKKPSKPAGTVQAVKPGTVFRGHDEDDQPPAPPKPKPPIPPLKRPQPRPTIGPSKRPRLIQ